MSAHVLPQHQDPVAVLAHFDRRCRENGAGLPRTEETRSEWRGIAFRVLASQLVAPLGEVIELFNYPHVTRVPATRPWVKGIANVRGTLMPIVDLQVFLEGPPTAVRRRSRVLVIRHKDLHAGLLVEQMLGLKRFFEEERTAHVPSVDATVKTYTHSAFRQSDTFWSVFSMRELAENEEFLHAGI